MFESRIGTLFCIPLFIVVAPFGLLWNWLFTGDLLVRETWNILVDDIMFVFSK